jgi:uncharacterized protein (DUF983 family)
MADSDLVIFIVGAIVTGIALWGVVLEHNKTR